jgi:transposase-like protein
MTEFIITEDFPKSQVEFDRRFSTEKACYMYLFNMRWPSGFRCCKCGHQTYWVSAKYLFICTRCEHQHSLTAGTIMHATKKPLRYWFKAMWWFTTRKSGVNAINLKDLLALGSYGTAWTWLHKLRRCTIRYGRQKLSGNVEVDEIYFGGHNPGKRGRGAAGKSVVLAAVEKKKPRKLGRIRLQIFPDCSSNSINTFLQQNVASGSTVICDGWKGYSALKQQGYTHQPVFRLKTDNRLSVLPAVHLVASLVKRLLMGTFHGSVSAKYLQLYLNEYVFRFNRRKSKTVGKKFFRIVQQAMDSTNISFEQITLPITIDYSLAN